MKYEIRLVTALLIYFFVIAFIYKEINPFIWEQGTRVLMITLDGFSIFLYIVYKTSDSEE